MSWDELVKAVIEMAEAYMDDAPAWVGDDRERFDYMLRELVGDILDRGGVRSHGGCPLCLG